MITWYKLTDAQSSALIANVYICLYFEITLYIFLIVTYIIY